MYFKWFSIKWPLYPAKSLRTYFWHFFHIFFILILVLRNPLPFFLLVFFVAKKMVIWIFCIIIKVTIFTRIFKNFFENFREKRGSVWKKLYVNCEKIRGFYKCFMQILMSFYWHIFFKRNIFSPKNIFQIIFRKKSSKVFTCLLIQSSPLKISQNF